MSGRQARWLEKLSEFDFEIRHIPGTGTVRALSEYVQHDPTVNPIGTSLCELLTAPLLVGPEALACTPDIPYPPPKTRSKRPPPPPAETGRPETGSEFARRMRDHFVLLGPGQRKKGGKGAPKPETLETLPSLPEDVVRTIPVTSSL